MCCHRVAVVIIHVHKYEVKRAGTDWLGKDNYILRC